MTADNNMKNEKMKRVPQRNKLTQFQKNKIKIVAARIAVYVAAGITVVMLAFLIVYILIKGVPNLRWDLFSFKYTSENVSLFPALVNTVTLTFFALIISVPLGVFSAIYMVEYAKKGNKLVKIVSLTTETLSGIPSIVYGLFGYMFFLVTLGWGYSMLSGAITLAIMILPTIMRTTEEALKSVPDSFREGSFGLGAGKLRTVFKIVLPSATRGILAGVILAVGRIVGETAALIFTAGTVAQIPLSIMDSGRTLSVHMFVLWNEGMNTGEAYATAVVLLAMVVGLNALSHLVANKIDKDSK